MTLFTVAHMCKTLPNPDIKHKQKHKQIHKILKVECQGHALRACVNVYIRGLCS